MDKRIRELRKYLGLTQKEFADRLGIKPTAIANYEGGRNVPIDAVISLICREFGVNENWLRYGEGEMATVSTRDEELAAFFGRVLSEEDSSIKKRLVAVFARLPESHWEVLADIAERIAAEKEKPED